MLTNGEDVLEVAVDRAIQKARHTQLVDVYNSRMAIVEHTAGSSHKPAPVNLMKHMQLLQVSITATTTTSTSTGVDLQWVT